MSKYVNKLVLPEDNKTEKSLRVQIGYTGLVASLKFESSVSRFIVSDLL